MTQSLKVLSVFTVLATTTAAMGSSRVDCKGVAADLMAMQKAQQTISDNLISNHESFASVLEEYSDHYNVQNMNSSAKAFRVRGQNAQKLNLKLKKASDQVIAKAVECLGSNKK